MYGLERAFELWMDLTGIDPTSSSRLYTSKTALIYEANDDIKEAMVIDPSQITTVLLFSYYVQEYMSERTFSVNQILNDRETFDTYVAKVRELYDILGSEPVCAIRADFEEMMRNALTHYGIDREDVNELVGDPHVMAFLRRDALRSVSELKIHQFTQGDPDPERPVYFTNVFEFWNVNSLIRSICRSKKSGVSLCLVRDPDEIFSYFVFAIRNGGTVSIMTDKPKFSHPLQKYMSRRPGKDQSRRMVRHHFPYDLLDIKYDDRGDVYTAAKGNGLVPYQDHAYRRKAIAELAPDEVIWTILMFGLIEEKFWKESYRTPELSYTGEMVKIQNVLAEPTREIAVRDYKPIEVPALTVSDLTTEKMIDDWGTKPTGQNAWMEERYSTVINEEFLNVVGDRSTPLYLPVPTAVEQKIEKEFFPHKRAQMMERFELQKLDPQMFGTKGEVLADYRWTARYNQAKMIHEAAEKEYQDTHKEVRQWVYDAIQNNLPKLMEYIAAGELFAESSIPQGFGETFGTSQILYLYEKEKPWESVGRLFTTKGLGINMHGGYDDDTGYKCVVNGATSTLMAHFLPSTASALALLCGCEIKDLPEVLQHWTREKLYVGNSITQRVDPLEWVVRNPWIHKCNFEVGIHMSKSGYAKIRRDRGYPPYKFWLEEKIRRPYL